MANEGIFNEEDLKTIFHQEAPGGSLETRIPIKSGIPTLGEAPQPEKFKPTLEPLKTKTHKFTDSPDLLLSKPESFFRLFLKFLGTFLLLFALSFTIINAPALISKFKYFWEVDYRNEQWGKDFKSTSAAPATVQESRIIIPKIKVDAPIVWNVSPDDMISALERGIAHYEGTALPGQKGNIFLSGHSSYYVWAPGDYKDIFALLDKLQVGDQIYVTYQGVLYTYEVNDRVVVAPDNLTVLDQTDDETISLMTCVPIGTNLKRLVVTAKKVQ